MSFYSFFLFTDSSFCYIISETVDDAVIKTNTFNLSLSSCGNHGNCQTFMINKVQYLFKTIICSSVRMKISHKIPLNYLNLNLPNFNLDLKRMECLLPTI